METHGKSSSDPDSASSSHSGVTPSKTAHKRSKGKSRVWEKVAWFTRRSRSKDHAVGGATAASSESDLSGIPLDNMEFDISPSSSCFDAAGLHQGAPPSWVGSSSSTDSGETFQEEFQDGYRVKRSRLYPNSEVIEQHCLKPSVARALFHQMEAASCRGGKGTKYSWQVKKKKKSHSIPWHSNYADNSTDDGLERAVSMPTGIMSASQCHCSACCTCTPTQRLMGMCPAHARLSSSTTSLDTGLTLSAASCGHDVTTVCSNQERTSENNGPMASPNTSFDGSDVMQRITESNHLTSTQDYDVSLDDDCLNQLASSSAMTHSDMLHQFKSNSLPMYFSKRCKLCNKPQTNKAHLPKYPHVPNATHFCTCATHAHPVASRAHPSNRNNQPMKPSSDVSTEEPVKSSYQRDKVDALEYKHKREMMKQWFSEFNDEQKNLFLKDLLEEECDLPQIHLLSIQMEPRMHEGCPINCSDILTWLPTAIANHILSFLDPVSLCRASMVCRVWHQLANDVSLWRRFCSQPKWQLSRAGEQKQLIQHILPNGNIHWKAVFSERFRLRNNWLGGRCNVRTFEGHTQGVSCVQFDDTRIVSGSSDKTIKVWNIRTNTPWSVQTLVGHSGTVRCLHLEGNRLVSGSTDKTIKVWDLSTQHTWSSIACKVTMVGHTDTVRCLQVDDEKVVSGSYDKTLKVWDIRSGRCRMTLRGHDAAVLCVQFDESKIVSGSCDKTIKLWTFEGACVMTLPGHHDAVTCLQFDDRRIVSGSLDCNLKFWDVHTGACSNTIDWKASEGHTGVVRCLQADSWRVVSASDDRTLKVWSLETGQRLVTLRNHSDGVTCLQFNDSFIVSGSYDKTVKLWDFTSC